MFLIFNNKKDISKSLRFTVEIKCVQKVGTKTIFNTYTVLNNAH